MSSIEEIDINLSRITEELDSMWRDIHEHVHYSKGTPVADIGTAINAINDIRDSIYQMEPSLKPKTWSDRKK